MALAVWPPPAPTLPGPQTILHAPRYPANLEDPQGTIELALVGGPDVWGRAGAGPDATFAGWIGDMLNNDGESAFGSWINVFRWFAFIGNGRTDEQQPYVAIELRTAAEIHTASGDPDSFGYTNWAGTTGMPAMDGLTDDGRDITWWTGNPTRDSTRFIRILIREDLVDGGAGDEWSGRAFFLESVSHELGHATMMLLAELYGDAFVKANLCEMFGRPIAAFDDPTLAWGDRVVEMSAEFFKDVCFPDRRYRNRANGRLSKTRFTDFVTLMFRLLESPYWDAANVDDLRASEDSFFTNLGSTSYIHDKHTAPLYLVNPGFVSRPDSFLGINSRRNLVWDGVTMPEITMFYNFDSRDTDADPVDVSFRWDGLQGVGDPSPGDPRYSFDTAGGLGGDPGNRVRWGMQFDIYTLDRTFVTPGTFIGTAVYPLWPDAGDPDPTAFIPPIQGSFTLAAADIEFAPGQTELPPEGFSVWPSILGTQATQPKYTLYPSEPHGLADDAEGLSLLWPWLEYEGVRVDFFFRDVPWPYLSIPGSLTAAPGPNGTLRPDRRFVDGQARAAPQPAPP